MGREKLIINKLTILISIVFLLSNAIIAKADDKCSVTRIVDGDTFYCMLSGKEKKIRLIGVDTPETYRTSKLFYDAHKSGKSVQDIEYLGNISKNFLVNTIGDEKEVRLDFDAQLLDKYGRTLAYVYLSDGSMLNQKLLLEGYAKVMTIPPNIKYKDLFIKTQKEAKKNKRGLWKIQGG